MCLEDHAIAECSRSGAPGGVEFGDSCMDCLREILYDGGEAGESSDEDQTGLAQRSANLEFRAKR